MVATNYSVYNSTFERVSLLERYDVCRRKMLQQHASKNFQQSEAITKPVTHVKHIFSVGQVYSARF
jgi:hypothetical protein